MMWEMITRLRPLEGFYQEYPEWESDPDALCVAGTNNVLEYHGTGAGGRASYDVGDPRMYSIIPCASLVLRVFASPTRVPAKHT